MKESVFQAQVMKWLRSNGCFCWKMQQNATTQAGVSDILFLFLDSYGFIECKKSASAPLRPGQQEFLEAHKEHAFAEISYPEIFEETKLRLLDYFEKVMKKPENSKKCRKCAVPDCPNLTRYPSGDLCHSHISQIRAHGKIISEAPRHITGATKHELYGTWQDMLNRCRNKNNPQYKDYGGRGIKVCKEWQGPDGFWTFANDMGDRPEGYTLDRINVDGNYCRDNCRWSDRHTQNLNTRRNKSDDHNIKERALKNGAIVFDVHLVKGKDHFCRTFSNLLEAKSYRDDMEAVLW